MRYVVALCVVAFSSFILGAVAKSALYEAAPMGGEVCVFPVKCDAGHCLRLQGDVIKKPDTSQTDDDDIVVQSKSTIVNPFSQPVALQQTPAELSCYRMMRAQLTAAAGLKSALDAGWPR